MDANRLNEVLEALATDAIEHCSYASVKTTAGLICAELTTLRQRLRSVAEAVGQDPDGHAIMESLPSIVRGYRDGCEELRQRAEAAETKAAQCEQEKAMLRDAFTAESERLAVRVRELEGALYLERSMRRLLEWGSYLEGYPCCPICHRLKSGGTHSPECGMGRLVRDEAKAAIDAAGGEG